MAQFPLSLYKALIKDVDAWCGENPSNTRGSLEDVAGVNPRVVYNWLELQDDAEGNRVPITPIPVAKLPLICNHINRYTALDILEAESGRIAIPLPPQTRTLNQSNLELAKCHKEFAEAVLAIVNGSDPSVIEREVREAVQQLMATKEQALREAG